MEDVFFILCIYVLVYVPEKVYGGSVFYFKHLVLSRKVQPAQMKTCYLKTKWHVDS